MTSKKELTVKYMKEKKNVPEAVKEKSKEFAQIKKNILKALEPQPKAIPQLAKELELPLPLVTYYLMTLRKYGNIEETKEINDDDYYLYRLKGNLPGKPYKNR